MKRRIENPLVRAARKQPTATAITHSEAGQSMNYRQLLDSSSDSARSIPNDARYVILDGENTANTLLALHAIWLAGKVAVVLNTKLPEEVRTTQLAIFKNAVSWQDLQNRPTPRMVLPEYDLHAPATVLFTSGSTGAGKAVVHTGGNHWFSARGANAWIPFAGGDTWLSTLPLYHVSGMSVVWRACRAGAGLTIGDDWQSLLQDGHYSHTSLVGSQLQWALKDKDALAALKQCKAILLGGSAVPKQLVEDALAAGLKLFTSYGSTELASQIATTRRLFKYPGEAKTLPFRRLTVKDGEIFAGGPVRFAGYLQPDDTLTKPFTGDGLFATGDLGTLQDGVLTVTGRKDNMLITGGENVQPELVEKTILNAGPGIERVVVVGLPDAKFGIRLAALIKPEPGIEFADLKRDLQRILPEKLANYQMPKVWAAWPDDKELTTGIKVSRQKVRDFILGSEPTQL